MPSIQINIKEFNGQHLLRAKQRTNRQEGKPSSDNNGSRSRGVTACIVVHRDVQKIWGGFFDTDYKIWVGYFSKIFKYGFYNCDFQVKNIDLGANFG